MIKEFVSTLWNISPGDPARIWRLMAASQGSSSQVRRTLSSVELHRDLMALGLEDVWDKITLVVRRAPLRRSERLFIAGMLSHLATLAQSTVLPEQDRDYWGLMSSADHLDATISNSNFCYYDSQLVAVGRVPFAM